MRRYLALIVGLSVMLFSAAAFAQDGEGGGDERSKFYNFEDMMVDGQLKEPKMMKTDARGNARFERLLDLKKSFLPKVQNSTAEEALD